MRFFLYLSAVIFLTYLNVYGIDSNLKTTVSLVFLSEIDRDNADLIKFINTAEKNLSSYKGFEYIPLEILLDRKGFSTFFADFKKAFRYISEGKLHYENMDFESSSASFLKAVNLFEKNSLFVNKQKMYLEALTYLGAISVLSNKMDNAYNYFKQIVIANPKYKVDSSLFPPQIVETFNKVSRDTLSTSKCVFKFRTEPDNAQVYLDGKLIGFSPNDKTGIICGNHFYYILSAGYQPVSGSFQIKQDQVVYDIYETLKANDNLSLVEKIQASVKQTINTDEYPEILSNLSDVDQIIIVYVTGTRERPVLTGVLYDNIGKNKINAYSVSLTKALSDSAKEIDSFITSVYLEIGGKRIITPTMLPFDSDMSSQNIKEEKIAQNEPRPIYQKWWFWIAIVGISSILITVPIIFINMSEPFPKDPDDHIDPFLRK